MKKFLKYAAVLTILLMVMALFTGCADKATGGGLFYDARCGGEEDKVTFGFNVQRVDECVYKGQLQAVNHGQKQKFHMDEITFLTPLSDVTVNFVGQDKGGKWVDVTVTDVGEPGASEGDYITIIHEEYGVWSGSLEGGNIQLHEEKD